jgi:hypothetical protein
MKIYNDPDDWITVDTMLFLMFWPMALVVCIHMWLGKEQQSWSMYGAFLVSLGWIAAVWLSVMFYGVKFIYFAVMSLWR